MSSGTGSSSQGKGSASSGGTVGFEAVLSLRPAFLFTKLTYFFFFLHVKPGKIFPKHFNRASNQKFPRLYKLYENTDILKI